jgi:hypothetical protein
MLEQVGQKARRAKSAVLQPNARYRTAIGCLGAMLPAVVALWPWPFASLQPSISAYYYTGARNWFVGTLWVLALFLFFYQYERKGSGREPKAALIKSGAADTILGMVAGASAFAVAMLPTTAPCPEDKPAPCLGVQPAIPPVDIGMAHGAAAAVLFLALALFPLMLFSQTEDETRAKVYRFCGGLMLFLLLSIAVYVWVVPKDSRDSLARFRPVYFVEAILIWVFALTWFMKGQEGGGRPPERLPPPAP